MLKRQEDSQLLVDIMYHHLFHHHYFKYDPNSVVEELESSLVHPFKGIFCNHQKLCFEKYLQISKSRL